jgi:phosphoserine phosphatase RsbU/P
VRVESQQDQMAITVADTGCGIGPEHLPRVFEPFFTTKANGTQRIERQMESPSPLVLDQVAICSRYVSCSELGGDLCDYVAIDSDRVALLIADVMGHGVSAAMLTGVVKSAFRAAEADRYAPIAVVERLRSSMGAFGPERFVTLIAGVMAIREGRLQYVNAGHPAGLLRVEDGGLVRLASTGPLISPALPGCTWEERSVPLGPGDLLLLYTDGVSDALASGEDSGEEPILAAARQHARGGAPLLDAILSRVRERIHGRPQADDLTLLTATLRRRQ